jgi:hypothetical protein
MVDARPLIGYPSFPARLADWQTSEACASNTDSNKKTNRNSDANIANLDLKDPWSADTTARSLTANWR